MRRLLPLLGLLLVLAACGGGLDTGKLEQVTKGEIVKEVGVTVASVDCPDDVQAKKGDNFTCTAKAKDGRTAAIEVVQTDDEGHVKISAPLLNIPQAERSLEKELGKHAKVECPDSLIVVKKGSKFSCTVTEQSGAKATVKVRFVDSKGNTSYRVVPAS